MLSDKSTGLVDDLTITYSGNRLVKIEDAADPVILEQSLDFPKASATMTYDSEGRLYSDTSRGIVKITYAPNDMPVGIHNSYKPLTLYAYAADGRKLSVAYANNYTSSTSDTRYYIGPIEFTKQSGANAKLSVNRVNLPWGYFDSDGSSFVNLTDYQGNIRAVTRMNEVVDWTDYYPYGLPMATSATSSSNRYKYSAKEFETRHGLDLYDYHARLQLPTAGLFSRPDPKAWDYPGYNPYLYCAANPIMLIDPTGKWSIDVHVAKDRDKHQNGFAVVRDRHGNEVFRFNVRARGYKGRDRMQKDNDTPTGEYKIPDKPWISGKSRKSYGPNPRLALIPLSGEALESGRDEFRVHGGQQEEQNVDGTWEKSENPQLKDTKGCIRAYDDDVKTLKEVTDALTENDPSDKPEILTVVNDLENIIEYETVLEELTQRLLDFANDLENKYYH